ncbi:MAG: long-chain fatty acid--CoA ligase [Gammaproteobacteria bacterium]|nr:long-chain fatty acid--CoA ligase [Gammaproteobacteria bacterium]
MGMQRSPLLMSRLIERGATVSPQTEIVTATATGTRRQTYAETSERAHQLAGALRDAGIGIGDRIGTFMWNSSQHVEAYHASAGMGAVLHTLNTRLSPTDLAYIINHAADRLIIVDEDLVPIMETLQSRLPSVERFIIVQGTDDFDISATSLANAIAYEDFIAGFPTHTTWPELDEYAPLGLCYTSGTTGNPKGVEYEHRAQYLHTLTISLTDSMSLSATDTLCGIVPMFHAMGWGLPWAALMLGCKQVLPHRFMQPGRLLQLIAEEGVTLSAGVPTIWQGLKAELEAQPDKFDLSRLQRLTCGGSAPPLSMIQWYWETYGIEIIQGWGMTEMSPLGTLSRRHAKYGDDRLPMEDRFADMGKAGLLMPGLELDVFNENNERLPHDGEQIGEIYVRGPWICKEYFHDPQPDKFFEDWLITGDVGTIDENEYLIIADRSKDLVKSGGEWISSVDLENNIVSIEGVQQACVVAQPHPKWDERPVALVVLGPDVEISSEVIVTHCAEKFAKWQIPDEILFVSEIPQTSTGKMDKKTVRANLQASGYVLPDLRTAEDVA